MASSIYNIIKSMYNEIQSEVTQSSYDENDSNRMHYKVMDVMDYSQSNTASSNNTLSNNASSNNTLRNNAFSNNTASSNTQSTNNSTNNNLRNYNESNDNEDNYYSGGNSDIGKASQSIPISNDKQNEVVNKLQNAVIMAEVLSQPVCRTRGYKRNKRNR